MTKSLQKLKAPAVNERIIKLFGWVLDISDDPFHVYISNTETVDELKKAILKEKPVGLAGIDADQLKIWKTCIKITRRLEDDVENYVLRDEDSPRDSDLLSDVFPDPDRKFLHIIVGIRQKRPASEPPENIFDRSKRAKLATMAPYELGKPLDDDMPPIPLLYTGFGHFLDIMDAREDVPGLADVDVQKLQEAVDDLASQMPMHPENEDAFHLDWEACLNRILSARIRGTKIPPLHTSAVGSDMHNIAAHGTTTMVVQPKSWLASFYSEPQIELLGRVAHLNANAMTDSDLFRHLFLRWRVPCVGITIVVHEIRFYAMVPIDQRFRLVALTPALSCTAESDGRDRLSLYSAFTALSVLQAHIIEDIERFLHHPLTAAIIPTHVRHFPAVSKLCKYPPSSNDCISFEIQSFSPDRQSYRLLYIAEMQDDEKREILVKFTRRYSIELHDFCAKLGYAPAILGFERLPGGWYAVAMEYVKFAVPITRSRQLGAHRDRWRIELERLVEGFHERDLVHGDLRDVNLICRGDEVMLVDYDWGGRDGEVFYPTVDLNEELCRDRGFVDLVIRKDDDRRVLKNTLDKLMEL